MDFSHYTGKPVCLAIDLINTQQRDVDEIPSSEEFVAFLSEYDQLWAGAAQPFRAENLPRIHELRGALRSVVEAPDVETASIRINTILDEYGAVPRVSTHSGQTSPSLRTARSDNDRVARDYHRDGSGECDRRTRESSDLGFAAVIHVPTPM